eukprot:272293_1
MADDIDVKYESDVDINELSNYHKTRQAPYQSARYTHDVLDTLGGIDKIVSDYITLTQSQHASIGLDPAQINQLHTSISTKLTAQDAEEDFDRTKLVYRFHTFNAGLYWLCQSQEKRDQTIHFIYEYVYNWITIAVAIVCLSTYSICWQYSASFITYDSIDGDTGSDTFFGIGIVVWVLANLWAFLLTLSLNRRAFVMLIQTFEFWVKVLYSISGSVFSFYIEHEPSRRTNKFILQVVVRVLFRTFFIFLVILMSSMDALPIGRKKQIFLCVIASCAITLLAITNTYGFYDNLLQDKSIFITSYMDIPTYTMRNSSYRIVALFFWKQTALSFFRTEKCISIKYTPFVEWIHDEHVNKDANKKQMDKALELDPEFEQKQKVEIEMVASIDSTEIRSTEPKDDDESDSDGQ